MSSVAATMSGVPNHALYAGSKAAVEGFTRSFSKDCGPRRITVNAIAPVSYNLPYSREIHTDCSFHLQGGVKSDMFQQYVNSKSLVFN
jgi:NAD(P)-dependent dehydrogenase (short-subunit alcohol dehydrogenase family)